MPGPPADPPDPDTTDLRVGAPIHNDLLALLPLVGRWQGTGAGVVASSGAQFAYRQSVTFGHDGRPFLVYESRSWLLDDTGAVLRAAWRESGFWRPGSGPDDVEVALASNTGQSLVLTGHAGDQQWDLETVGLQHTPRAVDVAGERRFYAVRDAMLLYATELAVPGSDFAPHLNAQLARQD